MYHLLATITCFFFVINVVCGCNLPPSLWCSSKEVARSCQVEKQCAGHIQNTFDSPVRFTLYYESLCPDCKNFFKEQLYQTFKDVGSIMNLTLVPYGNAREQKVGDRWDFQCQHGKEECIGNLIETCAINIIKNISIYMPFIYCIEKSHEGYPSSVAKKCAGQMGINYAPIEKCSTSQMGNDLEHQMAVKTEALQPQHTYVPWVTLNGVHNKVIQMKAENGLTQLICETYKGATKPLACSKYKTPGRCFKDKMDD